LKLLSTLSSTPQREFLKQFRATATCYDNLAAIHLAEDGVRGTYRFSESAT
jgi:hypothetical protein